MAAITLGQKGCLNANLEIAQSQGVNITITHLDGNGNRVNHTGDTGYCRLQRADHNDVVLDSYVSCGRDVTLSVPGSVTASIAAGEWNWDLFAGDVRLLYGKAHVYDTYARD